MGLVQSTMPEDRLNRQIEVLVGELEVFEAVRERYPTLDWQDFDGALLVHSSYNTMKNQLVVSEWRRETMRGRRLLDRLRLRWPARETAPNTHTSRRAQVTFADGIQTIPRSVSAHKACEVAEASSVKSDTADADCSLVEASVGVSCDQPHRASNSPPVHVTSATREDDHNRVDISCQRSTFKSLPSKPCTNHGSFKRYNCDRQQKMLNRRKSV